jgi:hypothetical protein
VSAALPASVPACFAASHSTHFHTFNIKLLFFALMTALCLKFGFSIGDNFALFRLDGPTRQQIRVDVAVVTIAVPYGAQHPARFRPHGLNQSRYLQLITISFSVRSRISSHFLQQDPNLRLLARCPEFDFFSSRLTLPNSQETLRPNRPDKGRLNTRIRIRLLKTSSLGLPL